MSDRTELARAEEDFARRQRAVRRRGRRRWLVVSAVVALVLIVAWTVLYSSWFEVSRVRVVGAESVTVDEIETVAAVPIGRSLVRLDTVAIAERVETVDAVADAEVGRSWPDEVVIRVTERVPVVAVLAGSGFDLVDGTGTVIRNVPQLEKPLPLGIIGGPRRGTSLRGIAIVVEALPDDLARRLESITADSPEAIWLRLHGGVRIVWGSAEDSARKAQVLTVLMKQPAMIYDVSAPDMPTTQGKPR